MVAGRARRGWTAAAGGAAFVLLVAFVWIRDAERRGLRDARIRAAEVEYSARLPRGPQPHAPLLGDALTGDAASVLYARSAVLCRNARPSGDMSTDIDETHRAPESTYDIDYVMQPYREALDALSAGAAAATILREWMDERVGGAAKASAATLDDIGALATLASVAVRHALHHDDVALAVQRTADALTLQLDLVRGSIGILDVFAAEGTITMCDTWTDERLRRFDAASLRALGGVLERFEAGLPPIARTFEGGFTFVVSGRDVANRHSPAHLADVVDVIERLEATSNAPWSVRRRALETLASRTTGFLETETARRAAVTHVRLLRLAIAHHLGEPLPGLGDPLGDDALEVGKRDAATVVISSRGVHDGRRLERAAERR